MRGPRPRRNSICLCRSSPTSYIDPLGLYYEGEGLRNRKSPGALTECEVGCLVEATVNYANPFGIPKLSLEPGSGFRLDVGLGEDDFRKQVLARRSTANVRDMKARVLRAQELLSRKNGGGLGPKGRERVLQMVRDFKKLKRIAKIIAKSNKITAIIVDGAKLFKCLDKCEDLDSCK